ncbi:hypothetical protein Tco_0876703 [Tanacetum coccineum]|uniref:Uncharacterized protein n=1 Tax=Tanacetum coccineum TaxID=301880 RepID=A0ABQ5BW28_9ASTR
MSTYLVNRSPSLAIRFKTHIDMLGFLGWLASIKQRMLEAVKVKCIFLGCREVAVEEKIYAYDSLTFNDIVTCEEKNNDGYYWEHTPRMFIHLSLYIDGMVFFADAWLRSGLPSKEKCTWYGDFQGSELENSKGVTIQVLQWKVGTYFVGGTLYIIVEG